MKVVHEVNAYDFKNASSVKDVFADKSNIKDKYKVTNYISVKEISKGIVNINIKTSLDKDNSKPIRINIFFPERKYFIEYIIEGNNYNYDFLYQMEEEKEYFNLVVFDQYSEVVTSTTYVFDNNKIIEYPIMLKDYSEKNVVSLVEFEEDEIKLLSRTKEVNKVIHTWQNVGQHYVFIPEKKDNVFVSKMKRDEMCAGLWMVIVTDEEGKLMTQFLVEIP